MSLTSVSNISMIVNSKIGQLRDNMDCIINDYESWLNSLIIQTKRESLIRKQRCEVCNSKDEFDGHHIAGRKHDHRQITACKPCHVELTLMQKTWDVRWLEPNLSENLKTAFFLLGLHDLLILKSKKTGISLYDNLACSLTETISELLKRG